MASSYGEVASEPEALHREQELVTLRSGLEIVSQRALGHREDARDAVQETLSRTLEALRCGRIAPDTSLAAFARGVHRHVVADILRQRYREPPGDSRAERVRSVQPSPLESLVREEEALVVSRALAQLNESDRELLRRCYVEGERLIEIARALGAPSERIRKQKSRALQRLRALVARHGPGPRPTTEP